MYRIRIKKAPGGQTGMGNGQWAMGGSPGAGRLQTGDQAGYGLYVGAGDSGVGSPQSGVGSRGRQQSATGNQLPGVGTPFFQWGGFNGPSYAIPPFQIPQERLDALERQQKLLREGAANNWLTIPSTYVADPYAVSPEKMAQLKRQQDQLREDMRNWVTKNPTIAMPAIAPVETRPKDTAPPKNSKGLSQYQENQLKLRPNFNRHGVSWLEQYGYAPTEEGYAQAIRDMGYDGDVNDIQAVQKHLINLNLLNGNTGLFEDLLKKYGMTRQGIEKGYDANWNHFGYDPDMNTAGWVKEMLENSYADNILGKRTDEMLEGLLKKPPTQLKGASVVDYLNSQGMDSSKENRKKLAQSFGLNDYNYSAADNLRLLEFLKAQQGKKQMGGSYSRESRVGSRESMGNGGFYQAGGAVKDTLGPVDRSQANIEAELGETAVTNGRHFKIGGKPHSEEGTPLRVSDGTFIFSNTRKLKMGGPMLAEFGKSAETKKKFTPAQLAKQYDLNRYQDLIDDPDTDPLTRRTAQLMLQNNQQKLAKLALLQEAMKGFPQGIPAMAMPLLQQMGMGSPEPGVGSQESGVGSQESGAGGPLAGTPTVGGDQLAMGDQPSAVSRQQLAAGSQGMGLPMGMDQGFPGQAQDDSSAQDQGLPVAQVGGQSSFHIPMRLPEMPAMTPMNILNSIINPSGTNGVPASNSGKLPLAIPSWFQVWTKSNTPQGAISPTGRSSLYDPSQGNSLYDDYRYWSSIAGRPFTDAKDYQSFIYNQVRKADPDALYKMWGNWGLTRAGLANGEDPNWGFADGYFGARTAALSHWRPQPVVPTPATPTSPGPKTETTNKQDQTQFDWRTTPPEKTPWWTQDKINLGAAFMNRFDLRKYMPTLINSDVVLPNSVYYDSARPVAATQGSAALQHMMSTMYGNPQLQRSMQSNIGGQEFGQVSNIMGDFANRNVAVGNQASTLRAGLLNQQNQFNRTALDAYLKGNTIANQQYDNSVRFMNNDIRRNWISGITNAEKTGWLNRLNPYYSINPASGQLFFKQGKALTDAATGAGYGSDPLTLYNSYVQQYMDKVPGADRKAAQEFALRAAFANKSQYAVDNDGDTKMSMSSAGYNPTAMMNMLGNYGQLPLSP